MCSPHWLNHLSWLVASLKLLAQPKNETQPAFQKHKGTHHRSQPSKSQRDTSRQPSLDFCQFRTGKGYSQKLGIKVNSWRQGNTCRQQSQSSNPLGRLNQTKPAPPCATSATVPAQKTQRDTRVCIGITAAKSKGTSRVDWTSFSPLDK